MDWKNIDRSAKLHKTLAVIVCIIVIVLAFKVGVLAGYRKAAFSYQFADNYYKGFRAKPSMINRIDDDDLPSSYGASGRIIKVDLPRIIIADRDNIEKTILITSSTIIKQYKGDASTTDIHTDDLATVIGAPNSRLEIEAKLIRLLPPLATSTQQ